jgi:predicted phosphodiesterase
MDYGHSFRINELNILALHGDLDSKNDTNILSKHSTLNGVDYDIILMGHYHTREIKELGDNKFLCVSGSLKGADDYSINKLRKISSASQTICIIDGNGDVDFKWVTLK